MKRVSKITNKRKKCSFLSPQIELLETPPDDSQNNENPTYDDPPRAEPVPAGTLGHGLFLFEFGLVIADALR